MLDEMDDEDVEELEGVWSSVSTWGVSSIRGWNEEEPRKPEAGDGKKKPWNAVNDVERPLKAKATCSRSTSLHIHLSLNRACSGYYHPTTRGR